MMTDYRQELFLIRKTLAVASQRLQTLVKDGLKVQIKSDGSPVTNGDVEVNTILQKALLSEFPDDGWLSEEAPDTVLRLQKNRVWILDPIDGTKPFIKYLPQFAISLALIDRGQPVIGIVFNPVTREYFCAVRGKPPTLNGLPLEVRRTNQSRLFFLVNTGLISRPTMRAWRDTADCRTILGSIAYSMALVATGAVDGVLNIGPQNEWDIAAAHLLVQSAGGIVMDKDLKTIQWNQPQPTVNGIIAARPDALPIVQQFLDLLHQ